LATMYKKDETIKRLVDEYEWRIHPVVNPDGYVYTHTIDRLWRKTRSVSKISGGCRGADGNRNFDDRVSFYFGLHSYSLLWMFPYSYTTRNATNYQELLATMYKKDETIKRLVDEYEWRIHPVVNPDGYVYTHTIDRLWRKTRSVSKISGGCRGADGNRNFDDRVSFYFGLHSYSLLWMFPYSYTTRNATNYQELLTISERGADAIRKVSGTNYTVGPINKIIYPVTGSSVDWAYEKAGVTKSFALELEPGSTSSDSSQGFLLPPKYILPTAEETWAGIRAAIGSP
ncbi:zinc carboxypeptidase-like, partial [Ixodes scapularis]